MARYKLIVLVGMLAQATAFADGGLVQLRKEAGAFVITVFQAPRSAGPVDISLLVQNRNGLEPVLDADVSVRLRADASGAEIRLQPTREQAQNELLYAAPVTLAESGKWPLGVTILRHGSADGHNGNNRRRAGSRNGGFVLELHSVSTIGDHGLRGPRATDPAKVERVKRCEISWS